MRSLRRILVAVRDPTEAAGPAVDKALVLARALGARLELFHALTMPLSAEAVMYGGTTLDQLEHSIEHHARQHLDDLADRLSDRVAGRVTISVATEWDSPSYEAIIRRALASKADLIVADRHAGRHVAAALLHYNDWELLRLSPMPVLLVKSAQAYKRPVLLAALDPGHRLEKPAQLDAAILDTALALSDALRGQLHALHAYSSLTEGTQPRHSLDPAALVSMNARLTAAASERFERCLGKAPIPRSRRHLLDVPPAEAITSVAGRIDADIVVMGAVSRSGLRRVLLGNTAEKLLDRLNCDLLIVKPKGFAPKMRRRPTGAILVSVMPMMA